MNRWIVLAVPLLVACNQPRTAHDADGTCHVTHAAETAGEGVKTGGTTAWQGIKTAGKTVGGFFSGGSEGARAQWKKGKKKTGTTARSGGRETKATAKDNPCR